MTERTGTLSRGSRVAVFLWREIHVGVTKTQTPQIFFLKKGLVNSPEFLSPNVLWSCNVHRQQQEKSKIFIFSSLSLSHRSSSEKLTRFKIAANILIAFAGEFFTEEIEDTESL